MVKVEMDRNGSKVWCFEVTNPEDIIFASVNTPTKTQGRGFWDIVGRDEVAYSDCCGKFLML